MKYLNVKGEKGKVKGECYKAQGVRRTRRRSNRLYRNCADYHQWFNENTVYNRERISMPSAELK